MAFTLPDFNLACDIWSGPWLTKVLRISGQECNLAYGRRIDFVTFDTDGANITGSPQMSLLLPALTDVRSHLLAGTGDLVEVPAGSGRWYGVYAVDDAGKGFDNEHRVASLVQVSEYLNATVYAGLLWPIPVP